MAEYEHNPVRLALSVIMVVVFITQLVFNGLSGVSQYSGGIFINNTGAVSDRFVLEITPSGATFSIWGVIYTWQTIWIIYQLVLVCRKSSTGYLYVSPEFVPLPAILLYILSEFLNVAWLLLWDRQIINAALPVLFLFSLSLYITLFIVHRQIYRITPILYSEDKKVDVWLARLFINNGIAFYATWCTVATLLNLGAVISYSSQPMIPQQDASTACLSILAVEIITWFTLDIFFLDKYVRYTFSPYIVLIVALVGVIGKNYVSGQRNSIFTAVLLAVASAAFLVKIVTLFWRHFKNPVHPDSGSTTKEVLPL